MTKEKVLLIDDEVDFTQVLGKRMKARGVDVDVASSGREALEMAKTHSYDAIVLDLLMPEMDGMETLKRLLQENPDLQIILLTGYASLEKGIEAVKIGAVDFLAKPAEIQDLMEKLQQAKANKMLLVEKRMEKRIKEISGNQAVVIRSPFREV